MGKIYYWLLGIKKEYLKAPIYYSFIILLLLGASFVRVYRVGDLLGFYYDQGRDALVIWKLWHEGKLFLTGPVTGLAGIFLGPSYYYLIAPFYIIGGGDPRFPAIFLSLISVTSIALTFFLAGKMHSKAAGLISVVIASSSYYIIHAGRWLSNPTPILLTSVILFWLLWEIGRSVKKVKPMYWIMVSLTVGVSLHFESASAVFYLPVVAVFILWQRKKLPATKIIILCIALFLATILPQILFDIRHDSLISNSFKRVLFEEQSFRSPFSRENYEFKRDYFINVVNSKIFPGHVKYSNILYIVILFGLIDLIRTKRREVLLFLIFLGVPFVGYIFFQGNEGHIYDYYLTGYYMPIILLFALSLASVWRYKLGKILVVWFMFAFLNLNLTLTRNYLTSSYHNMVSLGTELSAVDWVYGNSRGRGEFNVDIYVPPVIPHSYEYLLLWRGTKFCGESLCGMVKDKNTPLLYTIYEDDPPHPYRLKSWMDRMNAISEVDEEIRYGMVSAQRRTRK